MAYPGQKRLQGGDILNIDVTVILDGWYGDTSRMYWVGSPSIKAQNLTQITYECLMKAIDGAKPGATLGDIGHIIQRHAEQIAFLWYGTLPAAGWGAFSYRPDRIALWHAGYWPAPAEPGMIFTIEPMINAGHYATKS